MTVLNAVLVSTILKTALTSNVKLVQKVLIMLKTVNAVVFVKKLLKFATSVQKE
jgi:hypothetical protein